jgi:FkbM family methyltransferase
MDFSGISDKSLAGKALRLPLRLLPSGTVLPILQGKLKGMKWIVGSSNHGCWLGSFEYRKRKTFERWVTKGRVVFDIGANAGYYTLLASVLVGPHGRVFAFEPVTQNLHNICGHLRLNGTSNVTLIEAAVAEYAGDARFDSGANLSTGHLAVDGCMTVKAVKLDDMVRRGEALPPDCLKIDVEGAELQVLRGAQSLLADRHPIIFLATHSQELHRECCELLGCLGYTLKAISGLALDQTDEVLAYAEPPSAWGESYQIQNTADR